MNYDDYMEKQNDKEHDGIQSRPEPGYEIGEICNRDGCKGIIKEHDSDGGCSCHINPPCSYCTDSRAYCEDCEWDGREQQIEADNRYSAYWEAYHKCPDVIAQREADEGRESEFQKLYNGSGMVEKFEKRHQGHTHFSQIWYGVYPDTMSMDELLSKVKGTFGGRFERYGNGRFKYIAYTD